MHLPARVSQHATGGDGFWDGLEIHLPNEVTIRAQGPISTLLGAQFLRL